MNHEEIEEIATPAQLRAWTAVQEHGSITAAAESMGLDRRGVARSYRALEAKLAAKGHAPGLDTDLRFPDGQRLRGVSALYDADGNVRQKWVKTERDDEILETIKEMMDELKQDIPTYPEIPAPARVGFKDLLVGYPIGDHHMGMLAWGAETGEPWDVKIADNLMRASFGSLVAGSPNASTALLAFLGDYVHYDSHEARTPTNGNMLEADGRQPKMVRYAIRLMKWMIDQAARKHEHVHVIVEAGNHDLASTAWLAESMELLFEGNDRVTIDTSPAHYHYYRFGQNLIGTHHGHGTKYENLPILMANDRPEDWAASKFRTWWTGHVHHKNVKEFTGATVEAFRVLPGKDAWHHQKGYRSLRELQAIVLDREYGERARYSVNPRMFGL